MKIYRKEARNMKKICRIEFGRPAWDGRVGLLCHNDVTGEETFKIYKTKAAAKAAATRFEKAAVCVGYEICKKEA